MNKADFYKEVGKNMFWEEDENYNASLRLSDDDILDMIDFILPNVHMLHDFYEHKEKPDHFRCESLYSSYRIDENDEFKEALDMVSKLRKAKNKAIYASKSSMINVAEVKVE